MGSGNSARSTAVPRTPIPQYVPPGGALPPLSSVPTYNISRPPSPMLPPPPFGGGASPLSRRQQQKLADAQRTIQNLQSQMATMQRPPSPMSYRPPSPYGPAPYGRGPPIIGPYSGYPPPSPTLQRLTRQSYPPPPIPVGIGGYQGFDYAAVANIAGLNPADIALLHREYMNLTRGGTNKIDRIVFRQLLREALIEANNEHIDRTIETIFVSIDRNRDGFIDFPEFIGAFRDVLRGNPYDPVNMPLQSFTSPPPPLPINDQFGAYSLNTNLIPQAISYMQQQPPMYSLPPTGLQQSPMIYGGQSPLVLSMDQNQPSYLC